MSFDDDDDNGEIEENELRQLRARMGWREYVTAVLSGGATLQTAVKIADEAVELERKRWGIAEDDL